MKNHILFVFTFLSHNDFPDGIVPRRAYWIGLSGGLFAAAVLIGVLVVQLHGIAISPYFGAASLVEESAYTYTSSYNYLKYGYLHSGLLQDFSNSSSPGDHPYVYNHMPPGPDLVFALLLQITGKNLATARVVLSLIGMAGIWFFLRFVQILLGRIHIYGAGFVLLLINPWFIIQFYDRLIYNFAPFLIFSPYVFFCAFQQTQRRHFLVAAIGIAFASSLYIEYSTLAAAMFSWIMIYFTGLIPIQRRFLTAIVGAFAAGIGLHLVQNFLYFGPSLFFQELCLTLGNRTSGIPTQQELHSFFRDHCIVHHGSHAINLATLIDVVADNLTISETSLLFLIAASAAFLAYGLLMPRFFVHKNRVTNEDLAPMKFLGCLAIWLSITILTPIVLFPAFAQEVSLRGSGLNVVLLSIVQFAVVAFAIHQIVRTIPFMHRTRSRRFFEISLNPPLDSLASSSSHSPFWNGARLALVGIYIAIWCLSVYAVCRYTRHRLYERTYEFCQMVEKFDNNPYACLVDLKRYRGALFVTNINSPTVGFFTESAGYGVCGPEVISDVGRIDVTQCKVGFMRQENYSGVAPKYFFYFWNKELFPGFADALPDDTIADRSRGGNSLVKQLLNRLDKHYERVHQNSRFFVFDLQARKAS